MTAQSAALIASSDVLDLYESPAGSVFVTATSSKQVLGSAWGPADGTGEWFVWAGGGAVHRVGGRDAAVEQLKTVQAGAVTR